MPASEHAKTYVQASRYPATTRGQWEQWTQIWPISWLAPSASEADPEVKLPASEVEGMKRWMEQALNDAAVARLQGSVANAALIVDPLSGGHTLLQMLPGFHQSNEGI